MTPGPVEILLSGPVLAELRVTAGAALPRETGGLLLGWWHTRDAAEVIVVRHAIEVPDRRATHTSWVRRPRAAQAALSRALAVLSHPLLGYVGDWHSHPKAYTASGPDRASLLQTSLQYEHPVLLLIHLPDDKIDMTCAHAGEPRPARLRREGRKAGMSLPPRAAAIRGDDYQHVIGWYWACRALDNPDIVYVSVEDAVGGYFDDVVVRYRQGPDHYWQVKSSNYGSVVVDETWLLTPVTRAGHSPLQHFHATWRQLRAAGKPFELTLLTNRGFDPADPILRLRDLKTEKIDIASLTAAGPRSGVGRQRQRWASHLGIDPRELADFLSSLSWRAGPAESSWDQQARHLMRLAGLRSDDDAVTIGKALVRGWVTDGAGPMRRDDIRRAAARAGLLARNGTLVLAVHAIDRQPAATPPNVEIDLVDLYDGVDAFARVQLRDPADWNAKVEPAIRNAARDLEAYATRRVHVTGSMRLPLWFAVGRALPDVRGWVLSLDQRTEEWSTDATPEEATARVLAETRIGNGPDLAITISITHDISEDVARYISETRLPVSTLLVLGPQSEPGNRAVTSAGWAAAWVRSAREQARRTGAGAPRAHLYMAAPAALAMMLGHQWNLMPPTTVYEHLRSGYAPTLTFR